MLLFAPLGTAGVKSIIWHRQLFSRPHCLSEESLGWTFVLQVSKRSAGSVALSKVGGGEDGAEGGGGDQLLPDQVGAGEALPDEAVKLIWDQVDQEQFQESARKLSPLLKQGRKKLSEDSKDFTSYSIFS